MKNPSKFSAEANKKFEPLANKPKPPKHEFFLELEKTGRPDWKKAPAAVKQRYRGIFLVLVSIPVLFAPAMELYRRMEGKSTKKVQEGEVLEGQQFRKFDEAEKWQTEKDSLFYKIFGRDFYLDGFTSKTMNPKESSNDKPEKS